MGCEPQAVILSRLEQFDYYAGLDWTNNLRIYTFKKVRLVPILNFRLEVVLQFNDMLANSSCCMFTCSEKNFMASSINMT